MCNMHSTAMRKGQSHRLSECERGSSDAMQTPHDLVTDVWTRDPRGLPIGDHAMLCNNVRGTASPTHVNTEVTVL